ncbi:MAG: sodium/hydrogen exchanger [Fusobacteria bacterium]|nr:MAG: sodium/hydrogen exchanger [Fusobacteriota bacterium]KAF0229833.1 MAG: sodium/hydrogen [Fusobacteriota bacterium]
MFIRYKSKELANTIIVPFKKIWYFGELLLFTLVGAGLNLGMLNQINISHFIALFFIQLFISLGVIIVINFYDYNKSEKILYILSFSPKGTMQAALGFIPLSLGIVGGEDILIISIISILIFAPFGSIFLDRYFKNNNSPISRLK